MNTPNPLLQRNAVQTQANRHAYLRKVAQGNLIKTAIQKSTK